MPATVSEALEAFAQRRREPAPLISTFEPPAWPELAREATATVWARRVINETHSVELAERILECVRQLALTSPELERAIQRLIEDERTHVELARAFLDRLTAKQPVVSPAFEGREDPRIMLLRCVTTGLAVCESVSAARFALVRTHTDLPSPRSCIEYFLRDEIAHAELGFLLLPEVVTFCESELGRSETHALLTDELCATFGHLDTTIGLDAERKELALHARPQPPMNAGVVEPMIDAIAFHDAIARSIVPRLSAKLNIDARTLWEQRFEP